MPLVIIISLSDTSIVHFLPGEIAQDCCWVQQLPKYSTSLSISSMLGVFSSRSADFISVLKELSTTDGYLTRTKKDIHHYHQVQLPYLLPKRTRLDKSKMISSQSFFLGGGEFVNHK